MLFIGSDPVGHKLQCIFYHEGIKSAACICGWRSPYYADERIALDGFNSHRQALREIRRATTGAARYRDWKIRHGLLSQVTY